MPISSIAFGSPTEVGQVDALKAALAEFFSMLIFVIAGEGSCMAFNKLTDNGSSTPASLVAASLAHTFALFIAVSGGANISGGRINPAATFGAFPGGNVTFTPVVWNTSIFALSFGVGVWNAVVFETVMTFGLVYTFYATAVDPKKGSVGIIGPIAIGFIVGANILAGGAFDGASINPAVSFGLAAVSWTWDNHWVYWLGPFVGSAIAAIVYEVCFISPTTHNHVRMTHAWCLHA